MKSEQKDYRNGVRNTPDKDLNFQPVIAGQDRNQIFTPAEPANKGVTSVIGEADPNLKWKGPSSQSSPKSTEGKPLSSNPQSGKSENDYTPNFQGGVAGTDYPDPNNGSIQVHANGTKTQITADGQRIEWGTDEALQSAIKSAEDKKFSVTNRKVDYNTNLPSDFDPAGKDAYGHNMWLYELTGNDIFLQTAQGMKNL